MQLQWEICTFALRKVYRDEQEGMKCSLVFREPLLRTESDEEGIIQRK